LIARVVVTPKPVVNDPQGVTVKQALGSLGFEEVQDVRVGKYIEVSLEADSEEVASEQVEEMCRKLLANQVIEDYRYTIHGENLGSKGRGRQASESRGRQASPTGPLPQSDVGESDKDSDGAGNPPLPSDASSSQASSSEASGSSEKRVVS
jgi:phosphoribosylformylglycinamidine synthase subunit PurS